MAIGQGEIGATPLQLAGSCIIANKGWYIPPHIVRAIGHPWRIRSFRYKNKIIVPINEKYFQFHCRRYGKSSYLVVLLRIAQLPEIRVAAKTGTAQDPPREKVIAFL